MERTKPEGAPQQIPGEMTTRVFELRTGTDFAVFFADSASDLPGEGVRRELRAAARSFGGDTRGAASTLMNDGLAGIIGTLASAPLAAYMPATLKWLRRRSQKPRLDDVTAVMVPVRAACEQLLGSVPDSLSDAAIDKYADGQWRVAFNYRNMFISAVVEPTGSVVTWKQTEMPGETRSVTPASGG